MDVIQYRGGLKRTRQALQNGSVTLGFIGGSITDPRAGSNWPEPVAAWFVETFPHARVHIENAAIGATSSDLAVFRAERDLIRRNCDIVFIDYAVNDNDVPVEHRRRTREGLIRKLLNAEPRDLVLAYTYSQPMYQDMINRQMPLSILEFEEFADHYSLGSVWMGLHAFQEVLKGRMRWEEWLPDSLHPQSRGSLSYAQSVIEFLQRELLTDPSPKEIPSASNLPAPLNPRHWENAHALGFSAIRLEGPWDIRRAHTLVWIDQLLHTSAVGAKLAFDFTGRGLLLGFDFGKKSAEFRYSLDENPWLDSNRDRPDWCGNDGWYRTFLVADDLPPTRHAFRLEVTHPNPTGDFARASQCAGTNFNLALIGIIP